MAVTVLLELHIKSEHVEELKNIFKAILPDTRAYDGCLGLTVHSNQDDETNMVLIQQWESRAHYERYKAWRQETGFIDQLGPMVAAPPSIRYYDAVDA